jgi:hypothetical protein
MVAGSLRLVVDLLLHEVAVVALLDQRRGSRNHADRPLRRVTAASKIRAAWWSMAT